MRISLLFFLFLILTVCQAQNDKTYQLSKKKEFTIGATCLVLGVADQILSNNLKPLSEVSILNLDRMDVPSFDRSATNQFSSRAKDLSDVFEYAVFLVPSSLMISEKGRAEAKELGVMYVEAFTLNVFSTQFVKYIARRNRPFMYNESLDLSTKMTTNGRKSFYSGHVSHTATLSVFTAKVFSDLHPDSRWKTAIWATAFAIPVTTGYLRYKAGQHFPSDVAVGLIAGSLIGYFVPEFHRLKKSLPNGLGLDTIGNGISLTYSF